MCYHLPTVWLWVNYLNNLNLSFLIYKAERIIFLMGATVKMKLDHVLKALHMGGAWHVVGMIEKS